MIFGFFGINEEMNPPVEISEEGRLTITYYNLNDREEEKEKVYYRAFFSIRFRGDEKYHHLTIDTDKNFTYAWSFSLDHGPWFSGDDRPQWVMAVLRSFNAAGMYDDAEPRLLRLRQSSVDSECCYEAAFLPKSPVSVTHGGLFTAPRSVLGPSFSVEKEALVERAILSSYTL